MLLRTSTGLIAAAIVLGLLFWGALSLLVTVILLASTIAYLEYDRLFFPPRKTRQLRMIILIMLTVLATRQSLVLGWLSFWLSFAVIAIENISYWNKAKVLEDSSRVLGLECLGFTYTLALFGFMLPILEISEHGRYYILLLFLIVFCGDTCAYLVGSRLGKRKLIPTISPNKTVEGAIAGLVAAVLVSLAWCFWLFPEPPSRDFIVRVLLFAPIGSILAQCGDLLESMFKRSQTQKDSGRLFPGHGGLLDRIDGLALVTPIFYAFVAYFLIGI